MSSSVDMGYLMKLRDVACCMMWGVGGFNPRYGRSRAAAAVAFGAVTSVLFHHGGVPDCRVSRCVTAKLRQRLENNVFSSWQQSPLPTALCGAGPEWRADASPGAEPALRPVSARSRPAAQACRLQPREPGPDPRLEMRDRARMREPGLGRHQQPSLPLVAEGDVAFRARRQPCGEPERLTRPSSGCRTPPARPAHPRPAPARIPPASRAARKPRGSRPPRARRPACPTSPDRRWSGMSSRSSVSSRSPISSTILAPTKLPSLDLL